jgi:threonine dehydrogenase-like Zn-dependent dehydrogenase
MRNLVAVKNHAKRRIGSRQAVRAMVQTGPRNLEMQELPRPKVGPDEAILEVDACGISGTDIVVDVCGTTQAPVDAVDLARWGGTIVQAGLKGDGVGITLLTDKMVRGTISLRGVYAVDPVPYRQAIRLSESGVAPFAKLRNGSYKLMDAEVPIIGLLAGMASRRAYESQSSRST